ncbi:MAG: hypothetical protein H6733_03210 [Alphaproteobacteria bacterium]|nr:hypothetical protein [Alphaproteobacteria bacterium]
MQIGRFVQIGGMVGLATGCLGGLTAACPADADLDGICDTRDPCLDDPGNDPDGDGVCAADDVCPGSDDALDADDDGVPDGCDPCPDDPGNDDDGDGVCAADDPCPDTEGLDCTETVFVAIQPDVFYTDATWKLLDQRGQTVEEGQFNGPGAGYFAEVEVSPSRQSCLSVRDTERDGGTRGLVFSLTRQLAYASWDFDDYTALGNFCFQLDTGEAITPPRENAWLRSGACSVELVIDRGVYPTEIGWQLENDDGRVIQAVAPGSYTSRGTSRYTIVLTDGDYVFRMYDTAGDGWNGGGDDASFALTFDGETAPFLSGFLDDAAEGWQPFYVDCE